MALKISYSIFLIFLFFCAFGHAKRGIPSPKKSLPFDFKNLQGCHKGNHTKGIHQLKTYLQTYGYLEYTDQTHARDDDFDETLEIALKTYQKNYHINPTGILDATTVSKLNTPRCGMPDVVNGTKHMGSQNRSRAIHTVSHYSFFPGNRRWPPSKTHLTYKFLSNVRADAVDPVTRAFQKWASATQFTFSQVKEDQVADLEIGFFQGDHGDGAPFGGTSEAIAHAFAPTIGKFHYNSDEPWSVTQNPSAFHLETVAVHEIGHLLGLHHSQFEEAIMYAYISKGVIKTNLHPDDLAGIKDLYDV